MVKYFEKVKYGEKKEMFKYDNGVTNGAKNQKMVKRGGKIEKCLDMVEKSKMVKYGGKFKNIELW